jgi:tetrapyrrole methylase family protein/MazG family protein
MPGLTVVGLGPGDPGLITREAWQILEEAGEVYLRTGHHPVAKELAAHGVAVTTFDDLYQASPTFAEVYGRIVAKLIDEARRPQGVVYAVPGDPSVGESTVTELRRRAAAEDLAYRQVAGVSFVEPTLALLGRDVLDGLFVGDAIALGARHVPPSPPDQPALWGQLHSRLLASDVKLTLLSHYPPDHAVAVVRAAGSPRASLNWIPLAELDHGEEPDATTALFVPPLAGPSSLEGFQDVVARLRAPDGCPWDREQTHQSLRRHLLEEAYEVLAALDGDDTLALREELGDLLLQVVLQAQIAAEGDEFRLADVLGDIHAKIVRRHPHVFGDVEVAGVDDVLHRWEELKESEREGVPGSGELKGISGDLPALAQAHEMQDRAARIGFDWPAWQGVMEKLSEEIGELRSASESPERERELGDLLFSLVNAARWLNVDPESALRGANARFRSRFEAMSRAARLAGRRLKEMSLEELDDLWNQAKVQENEGGETQ